MPPLILIVDDRPEDILLTEIALSMLGCEIRTKSVTTGGKALELLRNAEELPSMILLDLKMPGMSGIETLRKIRADERLNHLPVLIVSCSTLEDDKIAAQAAGASGFLHKAITLNEFFKDLAHHVKCRMGKRFCSQDP